MQTKALECIQNCGHRAGHGSVAVKIIDSHIPTATLGPRLQKARERCVQRPRMQVSAWGGCKATRVKSVLLGTRLTYDRITLNGRQTASNLQSPHNTIHGSCEIHRP